MEKTKDKERPVKNKARNERSAASQCALPRKTEYQTNYARMYQQESKALKSLLQPPLVTERGILTSA
jgi:hypothetical protein